jgi:hypothetical protein
MRTTRAVTAVQVLSIIAALAAAPALQAQIQARSSGGIGPSVWKDANYRGDNATFRSDVPDLSRYNFRNSISSLRVANGEYWEVCDQPNYRGRCQVFSGSEINLDANNWNDRIVSIRRVRSSGGEVALPSRDAIVLSTGVNWHGDSRTYSGAVNNLRQDGFTDRVMSVRLGRGSWDLCALPEYRDCRTVNGSVADLSTIGFNGHVASIRPSNGTVTSGGYGERNGRYGDRNGRAEAMLESASRGCTSEVQRHGWTVASASSPVRDGSVLAVAMQVRRSPRERAMGVQCTYDPRNASAQLRF